MTSKPLNKDQIKRFLENQSDSKEANIVAAYFRENIELLDSYIDYDSIPENQLIKSSFEIKADCLNNILKPEKKTIQISFKSIFIAASIIAMITLGVWATFHLSDNPILEKISHQESLINISNKGNENKIYFLPDSSKIILEPNASISFNSADFKTKRIIKQLNGRVKYEVESNPNYPFIVYSNNISTTAVGTKFWVDNLLSENKVVVQLLEGSVKLNSFYKDFELKELPLIPGQTCSLYLRNGKIEIEENRKDLNSNPSILNNHIKPINDIIWTNNEIVLNKINVTDLLNRLEERYEVKIILEDESINNSTITGKIYYQDSLETILKAICDLKGLEYIKNNRNYHLRKLREH